MPDQLTINCSALNQILKDAGQIPEGKKLDEGQNTRLTAVPPETENRVVFDLTDEE
jgi:hypothetical protein